MLTPCVTRYVVRPPRVAGHSHQPPAASSRSETVTSARRTTLPPSRPGRDATSLQGVTDGGHAGDGEGQTRAVVGRVGGVRPGATGHRSTPVAVDGQHAGA